MAVPPWLCSRPSWRYMCAGCPYRKSRKLFQQRVQHWPNSSHLIRGLYMNEGAETKISAPSRFLPLLLVLFAASGASALIYEIVWYQLLELAIGASAISLAFLLATFMGGLCLGSLALPRFFRADALPNPPPQRGEVEIASSASNFGWGDVPTSPPPDPSFDKLRTDRPSPPGGGGKRGLGAGDGRSLQ